jgi:hypothetical protein
MLNFLKRLVGIQEAPPTQPRRRRKKSRVQPDYSTEPVSLLPEVVEGNGQSDWKLWQDSVNSQLTPLTRPSDSRFADSSQSQFDELDPYDRVGKNRDV